MAAAMNGMALHGGIIPYGGTFLVLHRLLRGRRSASAALMGMRVIYVMTHDSIGLGEDGPTHQPVEHLAALRAIPNLLVFRPADAVETVECWQLALENKNRPSVLALTRQNLPRLRRPPRQKSLRGRRLRDRAGRGQGAGDALRHRLGSRDRGRSARSCSRQRAFRPAWSRCPASNCSRKRRSEAPRHHRRRQGAGRRRGRDPAELGRVPRPDGRFRRHDVLWRERPGQGALQAFRHHAEAVAQAALSKLDRE